jgi:hypothetical protein
LYLARRDGEHDRVREHAVVVRLAPAVVLADRLAGGDTVAEQVPQLCDERVAAHEIDYVPRRTYDRP